MFCEQEMEARLNSAIDSKIKVQSFIVSPQTISLLSWGISSYSSYIYMTESEILIQFPTLISSGRIIVDDRT